MHRSFAALGFWLAALAARAASAAGPETAPLRLVPFPKKVALQDGRFSMNRSLALSTPRSLHAAAELLRAEFTRAGFPSPKWVATETDSPVIFLTAPDPADRSPASLREGAGDEDYALSISPMAISIRATAFPGLRHGLSTLRQLVRANCREQSIPCLTIVDWPSMTWRAFQDDITRGPSTTLDAMRRDVARGALLKLNIFTYYMQHQFAFTKHPDIGPPNGSLRPEELSALVEYAGTLGVQVMGNQQSFAHMQHLLAHEQYADLREDARTLSPVKEGTYQLLDDFYADVLPRLPFAFFNVCCDETWGLGSKGPSQALAAKIGAGGVYLRHIQRVHALVHGKYGKRMMMWGDIILKHPDRLSEIPSDVVMLTWAYNARGSFEDQIIPFANAGFGFFVCPGVSNWSRVLPDFATAATNIHNFVRDGAKHGADGMLITSWDDDGENLNAPNWPGFAWAAECAWNASTTALEDFNRRLGGVLFGEAGDHFGQAIDLLSRREFSGTRNARFWADDSQRLRPADLDAAREQLQTLHRARQHLEQCRQTATTDADLLDPMLFGVRRLALMRTRSLARAAATKAYGEAAAAASADAARRIKAAADALRPIREEYASLRHRWQTLWLRENRPYALDWTLRRYDTALQRRDAVLARLDAAAGATADGQSPPPPTDLGLAVWTVPDRLAFGARIESSLGHYQDYLPQFAFDGTPATFYWSDRGLKAGDHVTLVLEKPTALRSVIVDMGTSRYQQEYIHAGELAVSADGTTWTVVAKLNSRHIEASLPDTPITALRLTASQPQRYWLIIPEITLRGSDPVR